MERFGWPGTALVMLGLAIHSYSDAAQKRQMIEMYVLGHGTPYTVIIVSIVFVLVLAAQRYIHHAKMKEVESRRQAVEAEKDRLYDQLEELARRFESLEKSVNAKRLQPAPRK